MTWIRFVVKGRRNIIGLPVILGLLLVVAMGFSAGDTEAGEQFIVSHGIDEVVISPELQREAMQGLLDQARAHRDRVELRGPGASVGISDELNAKIAVWTERLAHDDFKPITIQMPYVHLGTHSIYWSSFSYEGDDWDTQADPTNAVVWGDGSLADFDDRMRTDTRATHRWQEDNGDGCFHVEQWLATKNASGDSWTWTDSTGLQHEDDFCAYDVRIHLRVWSLGVADSSFGDWSVVAVHEEQYHTLPWPPHHTILSWEDGEAFFQNSFRSSDGGSLLSWVDGITTQSFNNSGTFQGEYNNGTGYLIEVGTP